MIPGRGSCRLSEETQASAATLAKPNSDVIKLTGTTQIDTIPPPFGGQFACLIQLIPVDGTVVLSTAGNILVGITMAQNRATMLTWLKSTSKWYIDNGV
jgi:hypothetical protein